jgi:hypothetical protein
MRSKRNFTITVMETPTNTRNQGNKSTRLTQDYNPDTPKVKLVSCPITRLSLVSSVEEICAYPRKLYDEDEELGKPCPAVLFPYKGNP